MALLPLSRWLVYFNERILGKLIGDENFTIPFWNWDNPEGMYLPSIYTDSKSPLYDSKKNNQHYPPTLIDLNYSEGNPNQSVDDNLFTMYTQMINNSMTPGQFFGVDFRAGEFIPKGFGSIKSKPYNTVHTWTGTTSGVDMGLLSTTGRDPVFYSHHGNVDRMWVIWKEVLKHKDFADKDWLSSSFIFYDENGEAVRVKVRYYLDHKRLGYEYEHVPILWLDKKPTARTRRAQLKPTPFIRRGLPVKLDKEVSFTVSRPRKLRNATDKQKEEEVLVVNDIKYANSEFVKFDVFVDENDVSKSGPSYSEFAGSFSNGKTAKLRLGISNLLEDIEAEDYESILVTLVPRVGDVTVGDISITFEAKQ